MPHRLQFRLGLNAMDNPRPRVRLGDRSVREQSWRSTSCGGFQARPLPILAPLNKFRPKWISFDVTQYRQIMFIVLDRKRFKTSLPDMTASCSVDGICARARSSAIASTGSSHHRRTVITSDENDWSSNNNQPVSWEPFHPSPRFVDATKQFDDSIAGGEDSLLVAHTQGELDATPKAV